MKELLFKCFICLFVFTLISYIFVLNSYAAHESGAGIPSGTSKSGSDSSDNFDISGYETTTADEAIKSPFEGVIGAILSVIRIIGTGVAFIMIIMVAIKYMSAAPTDRADMKLSSIQFVVGAIIIFASTNILTTLAKVFTRVFPTWV